MNLKYRDPHAVIKTTQWFSVKIIVSCSKHFKDKRLGDVWRENKMINSLQCTFTGNLMLEMMRCIVLSQAPPFFFSWPSTDMSLQGSCLNSRVIKSVVYIWKRVFAHWCFALTTCTYIVCYHCNDSSCEYAGQ